mgnify:CR=1 FL=1
MTSITDILKPKSKDELTDAVKSMHPFQFVNKFRKCDVKGMKLGFKKRIVYFFAVYYIKYFSKIYWPIWGTWIVLMIGTWIWKDIAILNFIEDFFNWIIIGSLLPTMISGILNIYIVRWNEKHDRQSQANQINDIVNHIQEQIEHRLLIEQERQRVQDQADEIRRQIEQHERELRLRQQQLDLLRGNLRNL